MDKQRIPEESSSPEKSNSRPESCSSDSGQSGSLRSTIATNPSVKRLQSIISELLETEAAYLQNLRELEYGYLVPLQADPGFDGSVLNAAFQTIPSLRAFHEFFNTTLNEFRWNLSNLSTQFIHYAPQLESLYTEFCVNLNISLSVLQNVWRERPELAAKLTECQQKLGHKLSVDCYLTKPFQRILRYQLLLRELLKCAYEATSGEQPPSVNSFTDFCGLETAQQTRSSVIAINQALDKMIKVGENINESKRRREVYDHLRIEYPETASFGNLLLVDDFHVSIRKGRRFLVLFEKAVVLCKRLPTLTVTASKSTDPTQPCSHLTNLIIQKVLKLAKLILTETIPEDPDTFQLLPLGQPKDVLLVKAPSSAVKARWCSEIRRLILENYGSVVPEQAVQLMLNTEEDEPLFRKYRARTRGRSIARDKRRDTRAKNPTYKRSKSYTTETTPQTDSLGHSEPSDHGFGVSEDEYRPSVELSDDKNNNTATFPHSPATGSDGDEQGDVWANTGRTRTTVLSKLINAMWSKKRTESTPNAAPISHPFGNRSSLPTNYLAVTAEFEQRMMEPPQITKSTDGITPPTVQADFSTSVLNDPRVASVQELLAISEKQRSLSKRVSASQDPSGLQLPRVHSATQMGGFHNAKDVQEELSSLLLNRKTLTNQRSDPSPNVGNNPVTLRRSKLVESKTAPGSAKDDSFWIKMDQRLQREQQKKKITQEAKSNSLSSKRDSEPSVNGLGKRVPELSVTPRPSPPRKPTFLRKMQPNSGLADSPHSGDDAVLPNDDQARVKPRRRSNSCLRSGYGEFEAKHAHGRKNVTTNQCSKEEVNELILRCRSRIQAARDAFMKGEDLPDRP